MPLHPAIGSVQFPGGVPRQGGFTSIFGNAPVAIGPGSAGGYIPNYGGSPTFTPRSGSGAGSGAGGAITCRKIFILTGLPFER